VIPFEENRAVNEGKRRALEFPQKKKEKHMSST